MLTRRSVASLIGMAVFVAARPRRAGAGSYAERALGPADAAVTIIEYASLTCPHCAAFHHDTFGKLRAAYIDTGKIRFVFRDFPLDGVAVRAAALAQCAGEERYFGFVDVLFQTQATWAGAADPIAALVRIGRLGGLDEASITACLDDGDLIDAIVGSYQRGQEEHGVESTPTFIINGEVYTGERTFDELSKAIESLLPPV